jgi:hypothetical protein
MMEVGHSAFLAWLLDADGSHGQGKLFLRAFLDVCHPKPLLAIPDEYHVQTEFWERLSAIDILVYRAREFVLYIENKTTSPDTPDQSDREFKDMRQLGARLGIPEATQIAIYLTPEGRKPPGEHSKEWRTAAYSDVGEAFDHLLPFVTDDKVKFVLDDWLGNISTFGAIGRRQMMTQFTEESIFIAKSWNTVLDIIRAKEHLEIELSNLLVSVKAELEEFEWWDEGWRFYPYSETEIYIVNEDWQLDGNDVIWMGVYDFDSEHVFGSGSPASFYVRVESGYDDLGQILVEEIRKVGHKAIADDWYFIGRDMQKCLIEEEAIREYPDAARKQMAGFFDQYANLLMRFDGTIRQYLEEYEKKGQSSDAEQAHREPDSGQD